MLSHHTWSPRAPWVNVVTQCMPASEPTWLFFFWMLFQAKRGNNIELGERGHASFFAMSLTGWLFFLKNPDSVRDRFFDLRYGCANTSLNKFPFARATTPIQRHVHLHSCYPQTQNVPPRLQKQNCTNCVLHSACTVHCAKHNVCAPLYFHQQNAAILLLEACRHILH